MSCRGSVRQVALTVGVLLLASCGTEPQSDVSAAAPGYDAASYRCEPGPAGPTLDQSTAEAEYLDGVIEPSPPDPWYVFSASDPEGWVYLRSIEAAAATDEVVFLESGERIERFEAAGSVALHDDPTRNRARTLVSDAQTFDRLEAVMKLGADVLVKTWPRGDGRYGISAAVLLGADGSAAMVSPCGRPGDGWPAGLDAWLKEAAAARGQTPSDLVLALVGDPTLVDEVYSTTTTTTTLAPTSTSTTVDPSLLAGGRPVRLVLTVPKDWVDDAGPGRPSRVLCPRARAGLGLCTLLGPGVGTEFETWVWAGPDEPIDLVLTEGIGSTEVVDVVATIDPGVVAGRDSAAVEVTGTLADAQLRPQ